MTIPIEFEYHKCQYPCAFHKTRKQGAEWHHPCFVYPDVGLWLCEAHHSLLLGRQRKYAGELILDKSLEEMRKEIKDLELEIVVKAGLTASDIDKH